MAAKSSSGGLTPASESLVALTKIMYRMAVSHVVRSLESLGLLSRGTTASEIDKPDDFFWENAKKSPPPEREGSKSQDLAGRVLKGGGAGPRVTSRRVWSAAPNR